MTDTIAAIATGACVSAIGIVRISGEKAIEYADRMFLPFSGGHIMDCKDRKLIYGRLLNHEGDTLDICLCTVSRAPNSYTGENTAEFQCHGSPVVLRCVLEELFQLGARQALSGEFTKRAFLNGKMDLTSAEAVADIIDAETAETAVNAAGQLSGAIDRKTQEIYSDLADISSHFHAVLDYPDEDIEQFQIENYSELINKDAAILENLLSTFNRGRLMISGMPAVITGKPNVGKSSLLNKLLGYDRAIVTKVPGTTRDTIEEKIMLGGVCLRLIDTAGIHETEDEVELIGVRRSRQALESAELVIAVIDGSCEPDDEDRKIIAFAENAKNGLVIVSKKDIALSYIDVETKLPVIRLSAVTGDGIDRLESVIREMFPQPQVPAGEILTNSRHADVIRRALDYLKSALDALNNGMTPDIVLTETEGAMQAIGELSGKSIREDVTNRIFARFCVGK